MMDVKACAITGHRPTRFKWKYDENNNGCKRLKRRLKEQFALLIEQGVRRFYVGGALGVDLWSGELLLELKEQPKYSGIELVLALPFAKHDAGWDQKSRHHLSVLRQHSILIPAASLGQLARMCEDKDEFRVGTNGKNAVFCRKDLIFSTRLIQGDYIDTDRLTGTLKNQFTVLTDVAELRKGLSSASCVDPDGKVQMSFEGMTLTFRCTGAHGSAQDMVTVAPLTGTAQGDYWYLTKRLATCLHALSGTATLGIAAGGMLTLSTEDAFYMQAGVRPGAEQPKKAGQKKSPKPPAAKAA